MKKSPSISRFYDVFCGQVENPFYRPAIPTDWHGGFLGFRILIPIVANFFKLDCWGGVYLIWVIGAANLALIFYYTSRKTNKKTALLFTAALSTTVFSWGSHVYLGYPDAVSSFLTIVIIIFNNPIACAIATLLGMMNDERILLGLPLAIALIQYDFRSNLRLAIQKSLPLVAGMVAGWIIGSLIRNGIQTGFFGGEEILPPIYPQPAIGQYPILYAIPGAFFSFHALWHLIIISGYSKLKGKNPDALYWKIILGYSLFVLIITTYVWDYTRSLACLFPLFIISLRDRYLAGKESLKSALIPIIAFALIIPKMDQVGGLFLWNRPIAISYYELKTHKSVFSRVKEFINKQIDLQNK